MSVRSEITPQSLAVLGAVFVALIVNGALMAINAITIFMEPISADIGWTRAEIGGAISALLIGVSIGAPLFGTLVDRHGPRRVLLPLTLASGLLLGTISFVGTSLPLFYAAHFLLGLATPGAVAYSKLISMWFFRRRGIALTALGAGTFVGSVSVPLVARFLLESFGWHRAYLFFAASELLIAFPVLLLFFRERSTANDDTGEAAKEIEPDGAPAIGFRRAITSKTYWLVVLAQLTAMFAQLGIGTHAIGIMSEHGLDAASATFGVSALAIGGLAAQVATGVLLDKFDTPRVIVPFAALSVASLAFFYFSHGAALLLLSVMLLGFGTAGQTSMTSYFTTRYFGVRNFSTIYGWIMPVLLVFSAPAPIVVGAIFDHSGSYDAALILFEVLLVASVTLFLLLEPYPYPVRGKPAETVQSSAPAEAVPLHA